MIEVFENTECHSLDEPRKDDATFLATCYGVKCDVCGTLHEHTDYGFVRVPWRRELSRIKESELLEHLRAEAYGNQQPSLGWRDTPTKEGSTTIPQGSRRKRVEVLHLGNEVMI